MKGLSAAVLALGISVTFAIPTTSTGQQGVSPAARPDGEERAWTVSRTPDGQPDLQGHWTNATYTPFERPRNITKEFYTEEEYAALRTYGSANGQESANPNASLGRWLATGNPATAPEPGSVADVHYDFSQFGLARNQSAVGESLRTSLVVDPPDGRIPALTPEGRKRAAERAEAGRRSGGRWDAAQNNELDDRCIIMNAGPPVLPGGYNNTYQIVQGPGYVAVVVEMIHDVRLIPLDGRPHSSSRVRQWMGESRGRWEGDTLVVETSNFTDKTAFRGSGRDLRIVERFTRVGEDTIRYSFTAEDPSTWARPWSAEVPMKKTLGPIVEFACHEGNCSIVNALSGARADEQRAAEDAAKLESR